MTNTLHFSEWINCIRAQRKVNLCAPGAPKGPKVGMFVRRYEILCANDAGRAPRKYPAISAVINVVKKKKKGMVLYSAVSSPLDRSKRFTLSSPGRPVHSDTVLGFSWKHSSHAAIAQRLFTHMSTTVYSQVLIYTAESTEAS